MTMNKPSTTFSIDGRQIGPQHPPYIIAELSANHNGDLERAYAIMRAAKDAGADAIKLQTYSAETLTIDHDGPGFIIETGLWKGRKLFELYEEAGTPWEWHEPLFAYGKELGITVFSSPFDASAVAFLEKFDVPAYKVASFELVDLALIKIIAATGKPMIMSTGMARFEEIEEAIDTARSAGCTDLAVLHCISAYPAKPEESNLKTIADMAERLGVVIGLSDHTMGIATATAGVAMGANIIEKHVTLRRSDGGPDSAFSLEPQELSTLCETCKVAWASIGEITYGPSETEKNSLVFRRSLYVVEDIPAGGTLTKDNVRSIRPGFGLPPRHLPDVLGQTAGKAIPRGTPLQWVLLE